MLDECCNRFTKGSYELLSRCISIFKCVMQQRGTDYVILYTIFCDEQGNRKEVGDMRQRLGLGPEVSVVLPGREL